jgi:hypothetical protein
LSAPIYYRNLKLAARVINLRILHIIEINTYVYCFFNFWKHSILSIKPIILRFVFFLFLLTNLFAFQLRSTL